MTSPISSTRTVNQRYLKRSALFEVVADRQARWRVLELGWESDSMFLAGQPHSRGDRVVH